MESICLGTRLVIDSFGEAFSAKRIVVAGGASNSRFWLQIHADTIGAPLELTEVPDAPALGCAILAACGARRFATIKEGCKAMVRRRAMIEPDSRHTQLYEREIYRAILHSTARSSPSATSASCGQDTASRTTARILVKNTGVSSRSGLPKSATSTMLVRLSEI
jgi:sugar (pentulose or hexulose) kinase